MCICVLFFFFFFQAEDGIRDIGVTGVQTCALPISSAPIRFITGGISRTASKSGTIARRTNRPLASVQIRIAMARESEEGAIWPAEIGRASGRERGEISVVAGSLKKKKKKRDTIVAL